MATASGHVKLVKRRRGDQWYVKYRLPNGQQVQKRLGPAWTERSRPPAGFFTRRLAEEALRAILVDAQRGELPASRETGATFADAAAEFLRYVAEVRQIDAGTLADYRGVTEGYLEPEFGERPVETITPDDIDTYKERLLAEGRLSNRTIVRHLTVLHGIFKRAKRKWDLPSNPASADLVERPKVVYSGEFDAYDREELDRLAGAAETSQDATLYLIAAFTGLRTGELFALRWESVDFLSGLLHVRRAYDYKRGLEKVPKGRRVRSVPMMSEVVDLLGRLKEREHFTADSDLVFCSAVGEHLDYYGHLRRFKKARERADLRDLRFHDLRHIFGSTAILALDAYSVQSYMGHQHYSTTQRYLHHQPRREDAARLADAFTVRGAADRGSLREGGLGRTSPSDDASPRRRVRER
jgi:integrase